MKRDEIAMRGGRILLILQVCGWVGIALDLNHENERFFFEIKLKIFMSARPKVVFPEALAPMMMLTFL